MALDEWRDDLRLAARGLLRARGFAGTAVLNYFATLEVELVRGRGFTLGDGPAHLLAPGVVARLARERVGAIDPEVRVTRVAPFTERLQGPLARPRFNASLIGAFGVAALLLPAIGVYAVMGAYVRQRYPEIGVRVALGAMPSDVRLMVLGEGLRLTATGAAIGLVGALSAGPVLRGLWFEVHPLDPASLLGAPLLLIAAAGLASYLPARAAARLDPLVVLRSH